MGGEDTTLWNRMPCANHTDPAGCQERMAAMAHFRHMRSVTLTIVGVIGFLIIGLFIICMTYKNERFLSQMPWRRKSRQTCEENGIQRDGMSQYRLTSNQDFSETQVGIESIGIGVDGVLSMNTAQLDQAALCVGEDKHRTNISVVSETSQISDSATEVDRWLADVYDIENDECWKDPWPGMPSSPLLQNHLTPVRKFSSIQDNDLNGSINSLDRRKRFMTSEDTLYASTMSDPSPAKTRTAIVIPDADPEPLTATLPHYIVTSRV